MLVSGRVGPRLRSRAVGRRGGCEPFAADSGAGRWRALNSAHGADVGRRTLSTALLTLVPVQVVGTLGRRGHTAALGSPLPHRNQDLGSPLPHLRRDWAQPCPPSSFCRDSPLHTAATSAPGLGSPPPSSAPITHAHTHACTYTDKRTHAHAHTRARGCACAHTHALPGGLERLPPPSAIVGV